MEKSGLVNASMTFISCVQPADGSESSAIEASLRVLHEAIDYQAVQRTYSNF